MSALEVITALTQYNEWANGHVVETAARLSPAQLDEKLGASFDSVRGNLGHIVNAQNVWLARWSGEGPRELSREHATLDDLRHAFDASHQGIRGLVASLDEAAVAREVAYRDTRGTDQKNVLWRMVAHVMNHGTHHRAETAMILTMLGHPPRQLDYIFFELERDGAPPRLT